MDPRRYIEEMSWLPPVNYPEKTARDFSCIENVIAASGCRPDWMGCAKLAKKIRRFGENCTTVAPLEKFKIWITGNVTPDYLESSIIAAAPRHGLFVDCRISPFGQILQPFLTREKALDDFSPDIVVVYLDILPILLERTARLEPLGENLQPNTIVNQLTEQLEKLAKLAALNYGATVLVTTTPPPADRLFGSLDERIAGTTLNAIQQLNTRLLNLANERGLLTSDISGMAQTIGTSAWRCPRLWNKGKITPALEYTPLAADVILRTIAAAKGKSRRCLILDLDNTLWGGVVGDDGVDGIRLSIGDPVGEAHLMVQRLAKNLRERGVILAVSSKNDHETAIAPFTKRSEMILALDDISVFQANWHDKAKNIQAISSALNLGLGSMVLLDDNPVERAQVRAALPQVAVPELPRDVADFPVALMVAGYFESCTFGTEDRNRANYYTANAKRAELESSATNLDQFLSSLEMRLKVSQVKPDTKRRVTELFNKTNQFNLTTTRYSEANVESFSESNSYITLVASLDDRFGENGIISALVAEATEPNNWLILNWVMSCRVLGRKVEDGILQALMRQIRNRGGGKLQGIYKPTNRNNLVRDLYPRLGFSLISTDEAGSTSWQLQCADYIFAELPYEMEIKN